MGNWYSSEDIEDQYFDEFRLFLQNTERCMELESSSMIKDLQYEMTRYQNLKFTFNEKKNYNNYTIMYTSWTKLRPKLFRCIGVLYGKYRKYFIVQRLYDFCDIQNQILHEYKETYANTELKNYCTKIQSIN